MYKGIVAVIVALLVTPMLVLTPSLPESELRVPVHISAEADLSTVALVRETEVKLARPSSHDTSIPVHVHRVYRDEGPLQFDATWAYLPGEHPINSLIDEQMLTLLREFAATQGVGYWPEARGLPDSEELLIGSRRSCSDSEDLTADLSRSLDQATPIMHVSCRLVLASGSQLGQELRLNIIERGEITRSETYHFFVDTDSTLSETEPRYGQGNILFHQNEEDVLKELIEFIHQDAKHLTKRQLENLDTALHGTIDFAEFDAQGRLLFPLADGVEYPREHLSLVTDQPGADPYQRYLSVDVAMAQQWLSDWGRDIQTQIAAQERYRGPELALAGLAHVNCNLVPCLAVTYDDGPWSSTGMVLDALAKYDQAATFFVLGHLLGNGGWIVQQAHERGHEIGNHTWNHPNLNRLSEADVQWQVQHTNALIRNITGKTPVAFRPPYGAWSAKVLRAASGMVTVLWNVDSLDWRGEGDDHYRSLTYAVKPGDIVLFHDVTTQTSSLADEVVGRYTALGYRLVTIEQLLADTNYGPGSVVYYR